MATRKHQDLLAWQEAMSLAKCVYALTAEFPRIEQYGLTAQMRRTAVSVPSNIAEGAARATTKELMHFLHVARGSLAELDTQQILARELGFPGDWDRLKIQIDTVFKLLGGLINATRKKL